MGRPKGSKNEKAGRFVAELVANRKNFDPLELLIEIAQGDWKALGFDSKTKTTFTMNGIEIEEEHISLQERNKAAKEVAKYLYSAKQAIQLTTGEEGFRIVIEDYGKK